MAEEKRRWRTKAVRAPFAIYAVGPTPRPSGGVAYFGSLFWTRVGRAKR
jgi:hypothetical protein